MEPSGSLKRPMKQLEGGKLNYDRLPENGSREEAGERKCKLKRLPLPSTVDTMYKDAVITNDHHDDSDLHSGKLRSFPHERGNWATYIYIPYNFSEEVTTLLRQFLSSLPVKNFKLCDEFHVSLSKTVILKHHWIDCFADSVKMQLELQKRFPLIFTTLEVYTNDEKTRTFLGLKVDCNELLVIVDIINGCLAKFSQPSFYEDPSFHLSFGWCLGDRCNELKQSLSTNQKIFDEIFEDDAFISVRNVSEICCKTGNKMFNFPLRD